MPLANRLNAQHDIEASGAIKVSDQLQNILESVEQAAEDCSEKFRIYRTIPEIAQKCGHEFEIQSSRFRIWRSSFALNQSNLMALGLDQDSGKIIAKILCRLSTEILAVVESIKSTNSRGHSLEDLSIQDHSTESIQDMDEDLELSERVAPLRKVARIISRLYRNCDFLQQFQSELQRPLSNEYNQFEKWDPVEEEMMNVIQDHFQTKYTALEDSSKLRERLINSVQRRRKVVRNHQPHLHLAPKPPTKTEISRWNNMDFPSRVWYEVDREVACGYCSRPISGIFGTNMEPQKDLWR